LCKPPWRWIIEWRSTLVPPVRGGVGRANRWLVITETSTVKAVFTIREDREAPLVVAVLSLVLGGCENKSAQPPIRSAPARVISVGDDASVLRAFKDYGYPEEGFSVIPYPGPDGKSRTPRFFHLGNNWYIRVWHSDRIENITHFRAVPHEHAYTDFVDTRELTSFKISESRNEDEESIGPSREQVK
jgi:hypothetical protein